jgi:hypothetical protein
VKVLDVLKKSVSILDCLILMTGVFWIFNMDYENMGTSEKVYIAVFGLWILMLFVRIFIVYKNDGGQK